MRKWDVATSKSVNHYIAISETVANRIRHYYRRDSTIIYPPCDTDFFKPNGLSTSGDYYLTVSRLKAYKRIDLLVDAFNKLGLPLKIVGNGPEMNRLKKASRDNIEFTGWLSDEDLLKSYQACKAFVFAGTEDFGLVMAEAQSCGKPVIAYAKGGAREIVSAGKTGLFFHEQSPAALAIALRQFNKMEFNSDLIRESSLRFKKEMFKEQIDQFIKHNIP